MRLWLILTCFGLGLISVSCSPPPTAENVGDSASDTHKVISYDPPKLWGSPEYKARRAHDLAICRALGVEAGRLRLDFQDTGYVGRLRYVQAHQPVWVEKPVAEFRNLLIDWLYQDNKSRDHPLAPAYSTRAAMQRLTDDRIRDGEVRVQQASVHFRDMGDMLVTRMALARWRHSPTRLKPKPDIEWHTYNLLSRGTPAWTEEAGRFGSVPYWMIVVDGDAYFVRDYDGGRLEEPRMFPSEPEFKPVQVCAFRSAKTYDACGHRPADDPCLRSTSAPTSVNRRRQQ